jgi:hypothetical protein
MFVTPNSMMGVARGNDCAFFGAAADVTRCVVFQTSTDAGKAWSRSIVPIPADFQTAPLALFGGADPTRRNHFIATLANQSGADFLVYRTPDGGKTWHGPVRITENPTKRHFAPYVQYCSLNDENCCDDVDVRGSWLSLSSERKFAHLAFDAAHVAATFAGCELFLENFKERGLMEGFTLPRGESRPLRPFCGE